MKRLHLRSATNSEPIVENTPENPDVLQISDRIAERERAKRRGVVRRIVVWASSLAVVAIIVAVAFFSPVFALRAEQISITVGDRVDAAAVQAIVDPYVGTPLLRIPVASIAGQIEESPVVQSADVSRSFPGGLTVTVNARVPVAAVQDSEGYRLYDTDGVDMGVFPDATGIPVVTVPVDEFTADVLTDILAIMRSFPADLSSQISAISASSQEAIEFTLSSGAVVRWGGNSENELKVAVLQSLLSSVQARIYDVTTPRSPLTS